MSMRLYLIWYWLSLHLPRSTNHRNAMWHCSSMTSFRSLVIPNRYPPTKLETVAREGSMAGPPLSTTTGILDEWLVYRSTVG